MYVKPSMVRRRPTALSENLKFLSQLGGGLKPPKAPPPIRHWEIPRERCMARWRSSRVKYPGGNILEGGLPGRSPGGEIAYPGGDALGTTI